MWILQTAASTSAVLETQRWVRLVVVPTYTDTEENAHALGKFVQNLGDCVEKIELLPYHELGKHKWKFFEEEYKLEGIKPPSKETMLKIKDILLQYHKIVQ